MLRAHVIGFVLAVVVVIGSQVAFGAVAIKPVVEVEEEVYRYQNADNGAGPFWCFGSTCLVRSGEDVFASGLETIAGAKPLNNTRWLLYRRDANGWKLVMRDEKGRTREPSPMGVFGDGSVFLSANPTLSVPDTYSGPARPEILRFSARDAVAGYETILPKWDGRPAFTEHSYRSFAVDGASREMILFQNIGYTHTEWAFRDKEGRWSAGKLAWPWGAEYAKPQPIRTCYPAVQLRNRTVYFFGVSDIVEPNEAWRQYKKQLTGQEWDYEFRRLFYTWTDDITLGKFKPWVEIASREKTCGWIFPCDLYAQADGTVHVLWTERAIDTRLRQKFFPDAKQSESLNYAVIKDGKVVLRKAIVQLDEGASGPLPGRGRFHLMRDGRLVVIYHVRATNGDENRVVEIGKDGPGESVLVPMKRAMGTFFTASVRAGCAASDTIDMLGDGGGGVRYTRIKLVAQ